MVLWVHIFQFYFKAKGVHSKETVQLTTQGGQSEDQMGMYQNILVEKETSSATSHVGVKGCF